LSSESFDIVLALSLNPTMPAALLPDGNPAVVPRSADAPRPLRIAVVGAGVSGILAGIKLPQVLKENFELVIYDKNADVYADVDPLTRRKLTSQGRNVV
jgi:hypothetical protein